MGLTWCIRHDAQCVRVLHLGGDSTGHSDTDLANLDAALVAALMLTTLLPNFPALRDVDSAILRFFIAWARFRSARNCGPNGIEPSNGKTERIPALST